MEVSRAEGKIAGAVRELKVDFRGKTVLDIGSSTGGFTDLALKMGARKVIAVEKGTRQMRAPLRFDKRIQLYEKTDIFDVASWAKDGQELEKPVILGEIPDIVLADVSFVSLTKVLAYAKINLIGQQTVCLVMLKPQFEAEPRQLKNGIVKNNKVRREIIVKFEEWLKRNGFVVLGKRDSEVAGKFGNLERFYYIKAVEGAVS